MAGMTKVDIESPYPSGLSSSGVQVDKLTGAGADSTAVRAAETGKQIHITGGFVTMAAAGTLTIYSASTVIATVELVAAGTVPLPPVYTAAGEALNMANTDAVASIFVWCESVSAASGQYNGMIA